jgi:hypothetical protein
LVWFFKLTPDYVDSMPEEEAEILWQAITRIEAEQMLIQMKLADFPHMKKEARENFQRRMWLKAYPDSQESRPLSFQELDGILNGK